MIISVIVTDSFHRWGAPMQLVGNKWDVMTRQREMLYVLEHKTQHLLIHDPNARIVVFWHISNMPPLISYRQIFYFTPMFCMAAIFVKYCSTTVSCCNIWANLCCLGCSPLGEKSLWNGTIYIWRIMYCIFPTWKQSENDQRIDIGDQ